MTERTLSDADLDAALAGGRWEREGATIVRRVELENFAAAVAALNRIADLAEERNHHPDLAIHGWNRLKVTLSTHSAGGVTQADLDLAVGIDGLL